MSKSITCYFLVKLPNLEKVVEDFQKSFNILLEDTFSDDELTVFEKEIDGIAAVYVQPVLSELTFDDFYPGKDEEKKKFFFESCQSSILFDHLPYLESNPFQISYLRELLSRFDEVLIDRGGINELMFKDEFLKFIAHHKSMDSLIHSFVPKKIEVKTIKPVDPIDFLVIDVYKEIERLKDKDISTEELSPGLGKLLYVMRNEYLDPATLYVKSGLNAKNFDDGLEKLKFFLRKIS